VIGISQGQGKLLGKPALVAAIHHTALNSLSCPRADADVDPRKQQNPHSGCSDAVYLTATLSFLVAMEEKATIFIYTSR